MSSPNETVPKLYTEYALVYEEMYQTIFDYDEEYTTFVSEIHQHLEFPEDRPIRLLEIGCGSGHLAERFLFVKATADDDCDDDSEPNPNPPPPFECVYTGLDISAEMIELSRNRCRRESTGEGRREDDIFFVGDMRTCSLESFGRTPADAFDVILITGRSFCHLTTNHDILSCLSSIRKLLGSSGSGIVVFDTFSAVGIFGGFKGGHVTKASFETRHYTRTSVTNPNLEAPGWTWVWNAKYEVDEEVLEGENKKIEHRVIGEEVMTLRAMTRDEARLFLTLSGFVALGVKEDGISLLVSARPAEEETPRAEGWLLEKSES